MGDSRRQADLIAVAIIGLLGLYALRLAFEQVVSGVDGHAYWSAWATGELYAGSSLYTGTYVYPPPMAQFIRPLTLLSWPLFRQFEGLAAIASFMWLLWPLRPAIHVVAVLAVMPAIAVGNVEWLIGLSIVLGMRHPAAWAVPALVKVTTGIGALWFPFRGEWRAFATIIATGLLVVAISYALDPAAWSSWLAVARGSTVLPADAWLPNTWLPLPLRIVAAVVVMAWAARTDRAWLLPVAVILAQPDLNPPTFAILAACPRLAAQDRPEDARLRLHRRDDLSVRGSGQTLKRNQQVNV